jgi:hypothetical protein
MWQSFFEHEQRIQKSKEIAMVLPNEIKRRLLDGQKVFVHWHTPDHFGGSPSYLSLMIINIGDGKYDAYTYNTIDSVWQLWYVNGNIQDFGIGTRCYDLMETEEEAIAAQIKANQYNIEEYNQPDWVEWFWSEFMRDTKIWR